MTVLPHPGGWHDLIVEKHREHYRIDREIGASPESVFAALLGLIGGPEDAPTYARLGNPAPHGPGALVVFELQGYELHEVCVELEVPRKRRYRMVSGAPVDHYEALTEVAPLGDGSLLTWQGWTEDADSEVARAWNQLARESIGRAVEIVSTLAKQP
ncbi:MAG: SRPBCC family protein [bacterium]|nr:SRPBCC family protein [bacterium]